MKIRPYRKSDAKDLASLVRALARYEKLTPPSPAATRRLARDVGCRIRVLMAEVDGKLVGYAIYFFTLYLEDIFVLPEQRRLGLGGAFFKALLAEARREGCGRLEWAVLDWNTPAHRFYRKLGAQLLDDWNTYRIVLKS